MFRLVIVLIGVFFTAVGIWFYIAEPFPKQTDEKKQNAVVGLKAEGSQKPSKPPGLRTPKVMSFGDNPDAYFEPGEILVTNSFKGFETAADINGYRTIETVNLSTLDLTLYRLQVPAGITMKRARRHFAARFPSVTVDLNHHYQTQQLGASPSYKTHARDAIGWTDTTPTCGRGARIGMIDTAIDPAHPALKGQDIRYRSYHQAGNTAGPSTHGTAVAGMLAGTIEWGGLLPGAELYAANIFEQRRDGRIVSNAAAMMKAMDWLAAQKVHVINLSIAGADNKALNQTIKKVAKKGIALVAAAGNWGAGGQPAYPAANARVIAVTALNQDRKNLYAHANRGNYIDFAAPGANIWTASFGTGGRYQSGTSYAATYITALSALYVVAGYGKTVDQLLSVFRSATLDLGVPGKDPEFGWGFVNIQPKCV